MKVQSTCSYPVILTSKPYERPWKTIDKETGQEKSGSVNVIKGILIPQNPKADPNSLKEIEFNISTTKKDGGAKVNAFDVMDVYYNNKEGFESGSVYAQVETYMAPRLNKDGVVTFCSPWLNDIEIVNPSDEDKALLEVVVARNEKI